MPDDRPPPFLIDGDEGQIIPGGVACTGHCTVTLPYIKAGTKTRLEVPFQWSGPVPAGDYEVVAIAVLRRNVARGPLPPEEPDGR